MTRDLSRFEPVLFNLGLEPNAPSDIVVFTGDLT